LNNREKYLKNSREYQKNKRKDPYFRLSRNTSKSIWESLKKEKGGRHWELLVNFTLEELKVHLENQFNQNMSWENYGSYWEVDHIKPISLCETFNECWNLQNLQPLECYKNRSKGNKYEKK
jgi:5-methylcytosine-specific restriction endonuclease McrA